MSLNKCFYSDGGKHECCTHPHYCIFNRKRDALERKLTELLKEYKQLNTLRVSYILGYYVNVEYDEIIRKMSIVEDDIKQLNKFKKNILEKRIDGYGYEVLES